MKSKPWKTGIGIAVGLIVGVSVWWSVYVPDAGPFQNPQLVLVPAALGVLLVYIRNRRKKVGPYDRETIDQNRNGRV